MSAMMLNGRFLMGADMYAGQGFKLSLNASLPCYQVNAWCFRYDDRPRPTDPCELADLVGTFDCPAIAVAKANEAIPTDFVAAKAAALLLDGLDEEDFELAREFLRQAAEAGEGISGSY